MCWLFARPRLRSFHSIPTLTLPVAFFMLCTSNTLPNQHPALCLSNRRAPMIFLPVDTSAESHNVDRTRLPIGRPDRRRRRPGCVRTSGGKRVRPVAGRWRNGEILLAAVANRKADAAACGADAARPTIGGGSTGRYQGWDAAEERSRGLAVRVQTSLRVSRDCCFILVWWPLRCEINCDSVRLLCADCGKVGWVWVNCGVERNQRSIEDFDLRVFGIPLETMWSDPSDFVIHEECNKIKRVI